MFRLLPLLGLGVALATPHLHAMAEDILPYQATETTLENGLKVIVVPTGFPNLVSLQIPVKTGSRNEVEDGKTGFAHFFEHMMFRGTETWPPEKYQEVITRAGARQNAYTTDDYTNYHITFAKEDLERMLEIEADRFQNLSYGVPEFKTEARAVLGEYNKNFANPIRKLFEVQRDAAFNTHTYKHTTMGFVQDIEDMPNQYDYARVFFDRFYRPENTTVVVVGDVNPDEVVPLVEKYWAGWERGSFTSDIPAEPPANGPIYNHFEWSTSTAPLLAVAFHGPAFSESEKDSAAMDMLLQLEFGETSDFYRRLVQEEQKIDLLYPMNAESEDPSLINILVRVKDPADVAYVRDAILETVARARSIAIDDRRLDEAKSHLRYTFAAGLDSTDAIASVLAGYVRFNRDYDTLNNLFRLYDSLTSDDLLMAAREYLTDSNLSVTTVAGDPLPAEIEKTPSIASFNVDGSSDDVGESRILVHRSPSPQINFKLLFLTGSADDPEGKEGLSSLTARMVTEAGSDVLSLSEINKLLYPIAGGFSSQVDREMTVFTGSVHKDNLDQFASIALDMLLNPGLRQEDFERNRDAQKNSLLIDLIANNDEELGKERLQTNIFADTPYGHTTLGTAEGIDNITIDDIRDFMSNHYSWGNVVVGISGDVPDSFIEEVGERLSGELPAGPGTRAEADSPEGARSDGLSVEIIEKDTRATAISFGMPIEVTRNHEDFIPLYVARTWLGEHRSSMSHLYQRIREIRGMNYGDYAYIEAFPGGMFRFFPSANRARSAQIFEIWVRPVPPAQAHMALRIALHELQKLIDDGLTEEQFESTREYLKKNVFLLTDGQDTNLGYQLDSWWYDIPEFTRYMRDGLDRITVDDVNAAIRKHLSHENLHVVMITKDAEELKTQLLSDAFSPITYDGEKPQDLLDEDQIIGARKLNISPEDVTVTPVEEVFKN